MSKFISIASIFVLALVAGCTGPNNDTNTADSSDSAAQ